MKDAKALTMNEFSNAAHYACLLRIEGNQILAAFVFLAFLA